jgi:hypothetical protein
MWTCSICGSNLLNQTVACPICNPPTDEKGVPNQASIDSHHERQPTPGFGSRSISSLGRLILIVGLGTVGAAIAPLIACIIIGFFAGGGSGPETGWAGIAIIAIGAQYYYFVLPMIAVLNLTLFLSGIFNKVSSAIVYDVVLSLIVVVGWVLYSLLMVLSADA